MKSKGEKTKENILLIALKLFARRGVQNISFKEIADELSITQAALYKYFKNKDDLLKEAIILAAEQGRAFFLPAEGNDSVLRADNALAYYVRRNIEWAQKSAPYNVAFLSLHYFATQIPGIKKLHHDINHMRHQRIGEIVKMGIDEGIWSTTKEMSPLVTSIHNMLLGEMLEAYNKSGRESVESRSARITTNLLAIIRGH